MQLHHLHCYHNYTTIPMHEVIYCPKIFAALHYSLHNNYVCYRFDDDDITNSDHYYGDPCDEVESAYSTKHTSEAIDYDNDVIDHDVLDVPVDDFDEQSVIDHLDEEDGKVTETNITS